MKRLEACTGIGRILLIATLGLVLSALSLPVLPAVPATAQQAASVAATGDDSPRPGDLIRLRIWREPDFSGEFEVSAAGVVVFPRIGPLEVSGKTPQMLQQALIEAYQPFLNHSSIEVTLLRRVQILGAVRNPGLFTLDPTLTLADALALAGGTTPDGHPRRVELVRNGQRRTLDLSHAETVAGAAIRSGDQLYVPERGWLTRNAALAGAGITAGASLLIALILR